MDNKEKISHLKFIIGRYDAYANAVNTKGSFLLAFNSFAAGGYIIKYLDLVDKLRDQCILLAWFQVISALFIISSILSIWLSIKAVYPSLDSGNLRGAYQSLIYFGSVSELDQSTFLTEIAKQDEAGTIDDLSRQSHQVARIVNKKFAYISWASRVIYAELILLMVLFLLFMFNF
ncbi:Pycsar system effector family protein [Adhaeribacter aquaticus]|uniref:Pycsar system effector family protein n=1 Tax=Adhaeribacter aquaticus TaxID=299567 RepID=UPI000404B77C|nr:Pycsar system effector family protein [Adhaeribacter aquaticus]